MDTNDDLKPKPIISNKQIILKTLLYRFLAIFFTLFFSYMFTKSGKIINITILTEIFQTLFY